MTEKPLPAYSMGQRVRVILNERNKTTHTGTIRGIIWQSKDRRYNFYLEKGGKYLEEDLETVD